MAQVRGAMIAGSLGLDQEREEERERWASAEADRLDPILSGQIMTHLEPTKE